MCMLILCKSSISVIPRRIKYRRFACFWERSKGASSLYFYSGRNCQRDHTNGLQLFVFRQLDRARNEFCAGLAAELEMRAAAPHIALAGTGRPASCLDARHGLRRRVAVGLE